LVKAEIVLVIGIVGIGFLAAAAQPIAARLAGGKLAPAQIDATVTKLMEAAHVTGAAVAIFHDRKIAYLKAYGCAIRRSGCRSLRTP